MPKPPEAADRRRPGSRLTLLYVLALSTVALLSLGAQRLIQRQLRNGESDSRVINVAGRQRMLSQKLAKAALLSQSETGSAEALRELGTALREWESNHYALQLGDPERRLPENSSAAVADLFDAIEPHYQAIHDAATTLAGSDADAHVVALETLLRNEDAFLLGMDRIVSQCVLEAESRVDRLGSLEMGILGTTITVLLLEGLLIFRPATRQIRRAFDRLQSSSESLRHAKEEAERANAAKTRFLANVSHELRTPMTAVLGMTELARRTRDEEQRNAHLAIVEEAGESLLNLLNDLIDLARIDADQIDLKEAPFDPSELLERTLRMMRPSAVEKRIELRSVPGEAPPPRVWGDEKRLGQVLLNLVGNAIKWTDHGGVTIACRSADASEGRVTLTIAVSDTGVGIDPADQERVFEPFAQVTDTGGGKRGGAGLGLAISRRIVEAMGGRLRLQSSLGVGTTVSLECELPLATAAITLEPVETLVAEGPSARLLVIEDNAANQELLRATLEGAGHRVTLGRDAASGLEAFERGDFDLVLTDLRLPDQDGVSVAEGVRERARSRGVDPPPIVCVTAHAGPSAPLPTDSVFDEVITKPIRRDTLLGVVARLASGGEAETADLPPGIPQELAEAFVVAAPGPLGELRGAAEAADWPRVRAIAHRFANQVGHFNADQLRALLQQLEVACLAGRTEEAQPLSERAVADLGRLIERLREAHLQ